MLKSVDDTATLAGMVPGLVVQNATMTSFASGRRTSSGAPAERDWSRLSAKSIPRMRDGSASMARSEFTVSSEDDDDDDSDFSIDGDPTPRRRHVAPTTKPPHQPHHRKHHHHSSDDDDDDDDDDCDFFLMTPQPPEGLPPPLVAAAPSLPRFARPSAAPAATATGAAAGLPATPRRTTASGNCTPPLQCSSNVAADARCSSPEEPRRPPSSMSVPPPPSASLPPPNSKRLGSSSGTAATSAFSPAPRPPSGVRRASASGGSSRRPIPPPPAAVAAVAASGLDLSAELDDENPATVGASTLPSQAAGGDAEIGLPPLGPSPPRGSGAAAASAARLIGGHRSVDSAATAVHTVSGRGFDSRGSSVSATSAFAGSTSQRPSALPPAVVAKPLPPPASNGAPRRGVASHVQNKQKS